MLRSSSAEPEPSQGNFGTEPNLGRCLESPEGESARLIGPTKKPGGIPEQARMALAELSPR